MVTSESDLKMLLKALAFAAHKHSDQRRKDVESSPYINHPISLASILCNEGHVTDTEVICAALLHDTVEDTDTTAEELEQEFSPAIRHIVMDVTDDKTLGKAERKQRQVDHAAHICDRVMLPAIHRQAGVWNGARRILTGPSQSLTGSGVCMVRLRICLTVSMRIAPSTCAGF
jgi:(p)ppGpp synthase/HD superfamily hydrolase